MTDKAIEAAIRAADQYQLHHIEEDVRVSQLTVEELTALIKAAISAYLTQREADGFVMVPVADVRKCMAWIGNGPAECELHDKLEAMIAARPQVKP